MFLILNFKYMESTENTKKNQNSNVLKKHKEEIEAYQLKIQSLEKLLENKTITVKFNFYQSQLLGRILMKEYLEIKEKMTFTDFDEKLNTNDKIFMKSKNFEMETLMSIYNQIII